MTENKQTDGLKHAVLIDLDGTLCDDRHRLKYLPDPPTDNIADYLEYHSKLEQDEPYYSIRHLAETFYFMGVTMIYLTSRPESFYEQTKAWLEKYQVPYEKIFMRPENNTVTPKDLKWSIYMNEIQPWYKVKIILEDDLSICNLWKTAGLDCFRCIEGQIHGTIPESVD